MEAGDKKKVEVRMRADKQFDTEQDDEPHLKAKHALARKTLRNLALVGSAVSTDK